MLGAEASAVTLSTPLLAVLVVALVGVIILVLVLVNLAAKKRREALAAKAVRMGLRFAAEVPGFAESLPPLRLFERGGTRTRRARNLLTGRYSGSEVTLADYSYTVSSGSSSTTHRQTVCIVTCPGAAFPPSFLRREIAVLDALGQAFGGQDIDFEGDTEFSRAFVLQGRDAEATRRLFSAAVRLHVLRWKGRRVELEVKGDTLMLHHGALVEPDELPDLLQDAVDTVNVLRSALR
jgi:hypothetical protein